MLSDMHRAAVVGEKDVAKSSECHQLTQCGPSSHIDHPLWKAGTDLIGKGFSEVVARHQIQRSRGWLSKWLGRFRERGLRGLQDQSRAPKHVWRKTPRRLEQKVLAIRKELESHKTRRSAFAGIGAEVIQWELKQRG